MSVYDHAPRGWHGLLDDLIADLEDLPEPVTLRRWTVQGRLSFVGTETESPEARRLITETVIASLVTCEECASTTAGLSRAVVERQWEWRTLCADCAAGLGFTPTAVPDIAPIIRRMGGEGPSCSPGWWGLAVDLDSVLAQHDPDYAILEIKNKGDLRYYARTQRVELREEFSRLTWDVMLESEHVCQVCGAAGEYREQARGWSGVVCEGCWAAVSR